MHFCSYFDPGVLFPSAMSMQGLPRDILGGDAKISKVDLAKMNTALEEGAGTQTEDTAAAGRQDKLIR